VLHNVCTVQTRNANAPGVVTLISGGINGDLSGIFAVESDAQFDMGSSGILTGEFTGSDSMTAVFTGYSVSEESSDAVSYVAALKRYSAMG